MNCRVAAQLYYNLLRPAPLPFDHLLSPNVNAIRDLIASGFADFLRQKNMEAITPSDATTRHIRVLDKTYGIEFLHDFPLQYPLDIAYDLVYEKYKRKIREFFHYIDGGNRCLFIRIQANGELLEDSIALGRFLREKHGALHELLIISAEQSDEPDVQETGDGIYLARMSHTIDSVKDTGLGCGHTHWNKLLSNVTCRPMKKIKERFLSEVEKLLRLSVSKNKPLVFWGMGEMSERLLPYFLNRGVVPVFYDRSVDLKLNKVYRRIEKEEFLHNPDDYFVIVTPDDGNHRNEIVMELEEHGYKRNDSYDMIPSSSGAW
jgi:hypothetical protein